ncbi:MAG: serine/threonine protein kinase/WD40 repeat protein [Planctomycetota bacterium]|jgi:serine/threonine protein kinase/WD40 repeat protein
MTDERSQSLALVFLERFWANEDAGKQKSLAEYLAQFPGDEETIANEYLSAITQARRDDVADVHHKSDENRIGPYRLIKELGRGGQGIVWLAEDSRLGRNVALKVLPGMGPGAEEHLLRFKREAALASKLEHPGICSVYETGMAGGVPFIAMRYVDGETLGHRITRLRSSPEINEASSFISFDDENEEATDQSSSTSSKTSGFDRNELDSIIAIFEKIALALHAAHEVGIIHRDIKPGNIMLTQSSEPILLDFGLARDDSEDSGPSLTQTGDLFGTPAYMSPEQLLANRHRVDHRTDIYSLGVTLFECLTLTRPFEAPTRAGLYQAIMTQAPLNAGRLNPAIPKDLRVVLATTLEKDPDRRYKSALEFAEELKRVRERVPIHARPVSPLERLTRWAARNPALAVSLCGLFLTMLIGTVVSLKMAQRANHQKQVAEAESRRATLYSTESDKQLYSALIRMASTAAKERRYDIARARLESCPKDLRGWEWAYLSALIPQQIVPTRPFVDKARMIAASLDGRTVAMSNGNDEFVIADGATGDVRGVIPIDRTTDYQSALSPKGRFLISGSLRRRVYESQRKIPLHLWNTATKRLVRTFNTPPNQHGAAFDATGERVVTTSSNHAAAIHASDTGKLIQELKTLDGAKPMTFAFSNDGKSVFGVLGHGDDAGWEVREWNSETGTTITQWEFDFENVGITNPDAMENISIQIDVSNRRLLVFLSNSLDILILDLFSGELNARSKSTAVIADCDLVPGTDYFIPNFPTMASEERGMLSLWDGRTGTFVRDLGSHSNPIVQLSVDKTNGRILCTTGDKGVSIWPLNFCNNQLRLDNSPSEEALRNSQFVRFSPDGEKIIAGGSSGNLRAWNSQDGALIRTVNSELAWVSPHFLGDELVVLGFDSDSGDVAEVDSITGKRKSTFHLEAKSRVSYVALSHNGHQVAASSWNGKMHLFDRNTTSLIQLYVSTIRKHQYEIVFSPDDRFVAFGTMNDSFKICEIETGKVTALDSRGQVTSLAFSPDGKLLAVGNDANTLDLWEIPSLTHVQHWAGGHNSKIWSLCFSPDNSRVVAGDENGQMVIWHVDYQERLFNTQLSERPIFDLTFNASGSSIAAVDADGSVTVLESQAPTSVESRILVDDARKLVQTTYAKYADIKSVLDAIQSTPNLSQGLRDQAIRHAKTRGERPLELARVVRRSLSDVSADLTDNSKLVSRALILAERADEATAHRCPKVLEALALAQERGGDKKKARQTLVDILELTILQGSQRPFGKANRPATKYAKAKIRELDAELKK